MAKLNQNAEQTNYDLWQLERYGNILPTLEVTPDGDLFESGIEELNRMAAYIEQHAALELSNHY